MVNSTASFDFWTVNNVWSPGGSLESSQSFRIRDQAAINAAPNTTVHLSGVVANDTGWDYGLTKLGAGTLRLSGNNRYEGNTLLLQGELHVAGNEAVGRDPGAHIEADTGTVLRYSPGVALSAALTVRKMVENDWKHLVPSGAYTPLAPSAYDGAVRLVVDSGEAIQLGELFGSAPLIKQGAGLWRLSGAVGARAYGGSFTVDAGTLAVDSGFSNSVQVNSGARLQGRGKVGAATIAAGGILAPGNGLGQFRVQNNLIFEPGAQFEVDVNAHGASDFVQVDGKALLAGNVVALAQAGDWQASTRYTLLSAGLGFDNTTFSSVLLNQGFDFLTPQLSYDGNRVYLTLERNETALNDVAETPNDVAVADNLDGGKPPVYDAIIVLDKVRARQALHELAGSWPASIQSNLLDDTRFVREAVLNAAADRWAQPSLAAFRGSYRVWGRSFHSLADRAAHGAVPGDSRSIHGLVLGANLLDNGVWTAGALVGAQHSLLRRRQATGNASIDSYHAGLSFAGERAGARFTFGALHSWHSIASRRRLTVPGLEDSLSSRYRARSTQVFTEVALGGPGGRPFAMAVEPFVRFAWVHADIQGFTERGGDAALTVSPSGASVLFSVAGLRMTRNMDTQNGVVELQAQLAWRHASGTVQSLSRQRFHGSVPGSAFGSEGQPIARNAGQLQLGMNAPLAKNARLGVAYAGHYARRLQDHGVRLSLAVAF
ncbi:MAG TPA: autotransporter domain-containing protein [Eoetvoesiella sp.]